MSEDRTARVVEFAALTGAAGTGGALPASASVEGTSGAALNGRNAQVVTAIGQAIVGGTFTPGTILPREAELMREFAISRTSLREAIKVLAAKGLLESRQRVGTRVRPRDEWNVFDSDLLSWYHAQGMDREILQDLTEMRQILEPTAAGLAASRATMADLSQLEHALRAMNDESDARDYAGSDVRFHLAVYAASHNVLLARFGHLVADFLRTSFSVQQEAAEETGFDLSGDVQMHRAVYEAINRGASEEASAAMLTVVLTGKAALVAALADNARS